MDMNGTELELDRHRGEKGKGKKFAPLSFIIPAQQLFKQRSLESFCFISDRGGDAFLEPDRHHVTPAGRI